LAVWWKYGILKLRKLPPSSVRSTGHLLPRGRRGQRRKLWKGEEDNEKIIKNKKMNTKNSAIGGSAYGGKILTLIFACAIVFAMGGAAKTQAGTTDNVTGWIWGGSQDVSGIYSGLGWISMNSTNCDIDDDGIMDRVNVGIGTGDAAAPVGCPVDGTPVANYGVNIPASGAVVGYAWSENVGAIDFAPHSSCAAKYAGACDAYPVGVGFPTTDVTRTGGNLDGWARIVDVSKAKAVGSSGICGGSPCEGWIRMSGSGYGVKIDGAGKLSDFAWSDQFGYIDFANAMMPAPPTVTLNANPLTINVDNPLPQDTYLTWSSTNATSCVANTAPDAALWTGAKATASVAPGDAVSIDATHLTEDFTLTCSGPGGSASATVNVTTGCSKKICSSEICTPTFIATGTATNATCTEQTTCSADTDCASRTTGDWTEIEP
jgi:hypothetical protein